MRGSPCRTGTGPHRHHCSAHHAAIVRDYRDARQAYVLAREARTLGYPTEIELDRAAHAPVTFKEWLKAMAGHRPEDAGADVELSADVAAAWSA